MITPTSTASAGITVDHDVMGEVSGSTRPAPPGEDASSHPDISRPALAHPPDPTATHRSDDRDGCRVVLKRSLGGAIGDVRGEVRLEMAVLGSIKRDARPVC